MGRPKIYVEIITRCIDCPCCDYDFEIPDSGMCELCDNRSIPDVDKLARFCPINNATKEEIEKYKSED